MTRRHPHVCPLLLVTVAGILMTGGATAGCNNPVRTVAEGTLRNATANGATAELRVLGVQTAGRLSCRTPGSNTIDLVRVHCYGRSTTGAPIEVDGVAYDANTRHPRQEFVIKVDGREVLRKSCLAQGCGHHP